MNYSNKKVIIALSGGVDSAVAAGLLKNQGYDVVGAYFHFFGGAKDKMNSRRAKKIAEKIGIKFFEVYARKEFQKKIIDYFIESYKKGLTPNPCVVCNKEMKFDLLFDLMKKYRADAVATGHYARIFHKTHNTQHITQKKEYRVTSYVLREADDKTKDQSYFLYRLTQEDLAKIIFPLGDYKKSEVRKIAKKLKLPVAENESQDICFVDGDINSFLSKYIKSRSGDIVNEAGDILGKHKGLPLYTIGQRKGIEIGPPASRQEREALRASGPGPYFVIGKNIRKNELIVTHEPEELFTKVFHMSNANWIGHDLKFPLRVKVKIRYQAPSISAIIKPDIRGKYLVETKKKLRAVTPGQSAVFYKNGEIIGGGVII